MPVNYVAPSPISAANLYARRGGGAGGGGGGGYGAGPVYQIQDDTARLQNQMALVGMEGQNRISQINAQGNVSSALQENAAYLDAWQFDQKVTSQENAQYRQDMNSISAIDADRTMSPQEKQEAKLRIKSRIDWVGERQKRDLQQAQIEQAQSVAQLHKMQTGLEEQRLVNATALMNGKIHTMIRPDAIDAINRAVADSDLDPKSPEGQELAKKIAGERGALFYFPISEKGVIAKDPIPFDQLAAAGKAGGAGAPKGTGKGVSYEESAGQAAGDYRDFLKIAADVLSKSGTTPSTESIIETAKKFSASHAEQMGAYAANTPEGKKKAAAEMDKTRVAAIDTQAAELQGLGLASAQEKQNVGNVLRESKRLMLEYPLGGDHPRPKAIQEKLDRLAQQHADFMAVMAGRRGAASQPAAAAQTVASQTGAPVTDATDPNANAARFGVVGGTNPVLSSRLTPSQAIGNAGRNLVQIVSDAAPDLSPEARQKLINKLNFLFSPKQ